MNKHYVEYYLVKCIFWLIFAFLAVSGFTLFGVTLLSIEQVIVLFIL